MGQSALADATGIKYGTLRGYLRHDGKSAPGMDALIAIARATGIPDAFMLYGWQDPGAIRREAGAPTPAPPGELGRLLADAPTTAQSREPSPTRPAQADGS